VVLIAPVGGAVIHHRVHDAVQRLARHGCVTENKIQVAGLKMSFRY
jgi:hypothetical protein